MCGVFEGWINRYGIKSRIYTVQKLVVKAQFYLGEILSVEWP